MVTPEVLHVADELEDVLGGAVVRALKEYRGTAIDAGDNTEDISLARATNQLARALRRHPDAAASLATLNLRPSKSMQQLLLTLEQYRASAYKNLTTTVEDENSYSEYFRNVCLREEKAGNERSSIESQLKLERRERTKQLASVNEMVARSRAEYKRIKAATKHTEDELKKRAAGTKEANDKAFEDSHGRLVLEIKKLEEELVNVQKENKAAEMLVRKKKFKSEQEVQNWLSEYDKDMGAKEKAYQDERVVYMEVRKQLKQYDEHYKVLRKEAEAAEAEKRRVQDEADKEAEHQRKLDEAARAIQMSWKLHKEQVEAAAKAEKKKGGKKKK